MAFQLAKAYVEFSQKGLGGVSRGIGGLAKSLGRMVSPMGMVSAGLATLGTGAGASAIFRLTAQVESLEVGFRTLLGSADAARRMMEDINRFAASTPYEQMELAGVAKQLLAFGVAQEDVIGTMTRLGDIASLSGSRMEDLSRIFGKVKGTGRLMTESLNQFLERGIPLGAELARMFGVSEAEIRKMASEGRIGFGHMQTALSNLTAEGGLFFEGMKAQSETLGGVWSTLTGNIKTILADVGSMFVETFDVKEIVANLGGFVSTFKEDYGDEVKAVLEEVKSLGVSVWGAMEDSAGVFMDRFGDDLKDILDGLDRWSSKLSEIGNLIETISDLNAKLSDSFIGKLVTIDTLLGPIGSNVRKAFDLADSGLELLDILEGKEKPTRAAAAEPGGSPGAEKAATAKAVKDAFASPIYDMMRATASNFAGMAKATATNVAGAIANRDDVVQKTLEEWERSRWAREAGAAMNLPGPGDEKDKPGRDPRHRRGMQHVGISQFASWMQEQASELNRQRENRRIAQETANATKAIAAAANGGELVVRVSNPRDMQPRWG